jgi:hypothetical protein
MAFPTLADISTMLTAIGFPKHDCVDEPNEEVGMIRTGCGTPFGPILLTIDPQKERDNLYIRAHVGYANGASDDSIQLEILQYLNHLNEKHTVGKFVLDQSDYEVYIDCAQIITSLDTLSQETLDALIRRIVVAGTMWRPEINDISLGSKVFNESSKEIEDVDASSLTPLTDAELEELIKRLKG